ncbi:hypothetical protein C8R45DRAFT_936665 [Mycena sanguinolenta]|nr:hypothetical protein C8R45DRAFT_936665 [Mycena sanguinolenta]
MRILSSLLSFSLVFIVETAAAARRARDIGSVFAVYPGWDMNNAASVITSGITEFECLQSCASSSSCVAFAYVPYGNNVSQGDSTCVLKASIDISTFVAQAFDVSTGIIGPCNTVTPVGPTLCYTVSA